METISSRYRVSCGRNIHLTLLAVNRVWSQGSVALKDSDLITHVHIQLSSLDECRGGHLAEATVFSTAEVVIGELDYQLVRYADGYTGLNELKL